MTYNRITEGKLEENGKNKEERIKDFYFFLEEKLKKKRNIFRWSGRICFQVAADNLAHITFDIS